MPRFRTRLPLEEELEKIRSLAAAPATGSATANENNTESRWVSDPKRSTWSWARDDKPAELTEDSKAPEPTVPSIPEKVDPAIVNFLDIPETVRVGDNVHNPAQRAAIEAYAGDAFRNTNQHSPYEKLPDLSREGWGLPHRDSEFMSNQLDKRGFGPNSGNLLASAGLKATGDSLNNMTISNKSSGNSAKMTGAEGMANVGKAMEIVQNFMDKRNIEKPANVQPGGSDKARQVIASIPVDEEIRNFLGLTGS